MKKTHIDNFKEGDILTRIKPITFYTDKHDKLVSNSMYIGSKMKYMGKYNGSIYFRRTNFVEVLFLGEYFHLPKHDWSEGWALYEEPPFMKSSEEKDLENMSEDFLEKLIEDATKKEDYEKALNLKKKLEELKKKRGSE